MSSAASEIDPSVAPHIVVEESSRAGGSREEALPEAAAVEAVVETEAEPADGEEEGECGLCLYMEAGGCKEAFVSWMECVQAPEKAGSDMVDRCSQAITDLKKCMDAHADYYAPAAIAAATADASKNKGEESALSPDTDETKMEEALVVSAATAADEKDVVVEQEATSSTAAEWVKKEEAIVEKAESLSLGN
ncbi:hypothetical protein CFC21_038290 [Triticum aestivum]|uniref:GCK domain-containing protein n=2 Tax=Triticum aestivum TaxID=4565 RepID=A0A3B6EQC8_WHEAT|nr:hypothetical protein CFC21_038290 [Triticum aestivum]